MKVYPDIPHVEVKPLSAANGDLWVDKSTGALFVYTHNKWIEFNTPPLPGTCNYCGSGWNENRFHPGTCGNCGAPERDAYEETPVSLRGLADDDHPQYLI